MATLYLFPTAEEAAGLLSRRPDLREQVAVIGVGQAAAAASAARLIAHRKPSCVVLGGIAGAFDGRLALCEVVAVVQDRVAFLPERYSKDYHASKVEGLTAVGSYTVNRTGEAASLCKHSPLPAVEQMEGAAVAALCQEMGVEHYYHLRAISNYVDDERSAWRIKEAVEALGERIATLKL